MELKAVETYAKKALVKHGLADKGWVFKWDKRATKRFGQCRYYRKEIGISNQLASLNKAEDVFDTVLHEIAHALASVRGFVRARHGIEWQRICVEIGAKPSQYYSSDQIVIPKGKYSGTCPKCSHKFEKSRIPRRRTYHIACNSRGKYAYPIAWVDNRTRKVVDLC